MGGAYSIRAAGLLASLLVASAHAAEKEAVFNWNKVMPEHGISCFTYDGGKKPDKPNASAFGSMRLVVTHSVNSKQYNMISDYPVAWMQVVLAYTIVGDGNQRWITGSCDDHFDDNEKHRENVMRCAAACESSSEKEFEVELLADNTIKLTISRQRAPFCHIDGRLDMLVSRTVRLKPESPARCFIK
jgi:hypothetical protein